MPLAVPHLNGRESEYLQECIESTFVSSAGPFVTRFEEGIAQVSGTATASVVCAGTVALQMALEGLGTTRGDLVMAPSLTFIASANAIRHSGAEVWLIDVDESSWSLDVDLARTAIEQETDPHPRGRLHRESGLILTSIMPVMVMGATLDFDAYVALGREFGLSVVVDAAAAIGATGANGEPLGQTGVDAVCYSFNGNKTITSGGGGAVASKDAEFVARVQHLISTGRVGQEYDHDVVGYNFRMTNVEAAIGVAQLEQLADFLKRKTEVHDRYASMVQPYGEVSPFPTPRAGTSTFWFSGFVYRGDDDSFCDSFRAHMNGLGIDVRPFWKPVHLQLPYRDAPRSDMPIAEGLWPRIVPLPCSTGITAEQLEHVADSADSFFRSRALDSGSA